MTWDVRSVMAMTVVVAMIAVMFMLMFYPRSIDSDLLKVVVGGFMTVGFSAIISYYFGSSAESKSKSETIASIATTAVQQQPAPASPPAPSPPSPPGGAPP